jgi:Cd2+/Zn2+-exporting ATPase
VAMAVLPPLFLSEPWGAWVYRGLVLLVIGCPCALVISTPVAIVASLAAAARHGVLLKGGRLAELPAALRAVAFDKTGTLTEGRPTVVGILPVGGRDPAEILSKAAALESRSEHPIARAILARARHDKVPRLQASEVVAEPGKGIRGLVQGRRCWLGSPRWVDDPQLHAQVEQGHTAVALLEEEQVLGLIAVRDVLRPGAREAVAALKRAGVGKIVMLTGDQKATAEAIAEQAGADEVHAELLPEDKVKAIEALEHTLGPVAMVGDGVNDAPALARATLGVAMGAAGTDVALETADVALMGDDLSKLAWLVEHSKATMAIIWANTAFALGIKALFALLALMGVASLWGAIAADMGASLLVVANALRLLRR